MILSVLLAILKWIGIILLSILGLIILLILLILFCPFTYSLSAAGDIKDKDNIFVQAKLGWLFYLIRPVVTYKDKKVSIIIRIFGIPINLSREKQPKKTKKSEDIKIEESSLLSYNESKAPDDLEASFSEEELKEFDAFDKNDQINKKKPLKDKLKDKLKKDDKASKEKKKLSPEEKERIKAEQLKAKEEKKKARQEQINKLKDAWETFKKQETKDAIRLVKNIIIKTIRHIGPKSYKGHINYGMEDPCTTGQILAGIAAVYPVFRGRLTVCPYFETDQMILNGDIKLKGRIFVVFFIAQALKVWKNKTIRELIKKAR